MIGSKKFNPEPAVQEKAALQDSEDAEETFSFYNLSLNSCEAYWENFSKQDRSSSFDHQDFFFSEELSSTTYSSESVIFCGKLIPYKEQIINPEMIKSDKPKHTKKRSIFISKSSQYSTDHEKASSIISNTSTTRKKQEKNHDKSSDSTPAVRKPETNANTNKGHASRRLSVDKNNSSMRKASNLSPMMKSGCYSFRLGVGKIPMEMDLSDMRMRQSRRSPARLFPSNDECDHMDKISSKGKREKNFWDLFKGKASLGCIPQV